MSTCHLCYRFPASQEICTSIMTSSNGNIFCVTGPLCGEFTGHRWIPCTKASDAELWYSWSWSWWILCKSPEGATRRGREHAYGLGAASRLLNTERESVSAKAAGRLFQSGIVRNIEQCQSGDDLSLALGRWRFSWFFESRAGLVARWVFIESGGTASRLWRIL